MSFGNHLKDSFICHVFHEMFMPCISNFRIKYKSDIIKGSCIFLSTIRRKIKISIK